IDLAKAIAGLTAAESGQLADIFRAEANRLKTEARLLMEVLGPTGNVSSLIPADNAGLGLARAAAVVRLLSFEERLKGYTLLPLSGGQLIGVEDGLKKGGGGDEGERRRIEIRVRRPNSAVPPVGPVPPPAAAPAAPPETRPAPPQTRAASPPT